MRKIKISALVLFGFMLSPFTLKAQLGQTCQSPIPITTGVMCNVTDNLSLNDNIWFSFVAGSSTERLSLTNTISPADTPVAHVSQVIFYNSDCSNLSPISTWTNPQHSSFVIDTITGLTPGTTYYINVLGFAPGTTPCLACNAGRAYVGICMQDLITASVNCQLICNGNFESGAAPYCDPNNPGHFANFSASRATCWAITSDGTPDYWQVSAYPNMSNCLNAFPVQHTPSGDRSIAFSMGGNQSSQAQYREFIWQQTANSQAGATYRITFYYYGANRSNLNISAYVSPSPLPNFIAGTTPLPTTETYAGNGWTLVTCYYTSSGGSLFIALGGFSTQSITSNPEYIFLDDVAMDEILPVTVNGPTSFCTGTGPATTFAAASGATSYTWSISPALSSPYYTVSGSTVTVTNSPSFPASNLGTTYTLTLTSTMPDGCSSVQTFPLNVIQSPPAPILIPQGPLVYCQGGTPPILRAIATYSPSIQWYSTANGHITSADGVINFQSPGPGTYWFCSSWAGGSCPACTSPVTVIDKPHTLS